ncbi:MAG: hypothetical protein EBS05_21860 [Proteobacteria bacterium]|nr:hypothetical protein [Pseudomonadota bacterium]
MSAGALQQISLRIDALQRGRRQLGDATSNGVIALRALLPVQVYATMDAGRGLEAQVEAQTRATAPDHLSTFEKMVALFAGSTTNIVVIALSNLWGTLWHLLQSLVGASYSEILRDLVAENEKAKKEITGLWGSVMHRYGNVMENLQRVYQYARGPTMPPALASFIASVLKSADSLIVAIDEAAATNSQRAAALQSALQSAPAAAAAATVRQMVAANSALRQRSITYFAVHISAAAQVAPPLQQLWSDQIYKAILASEASLPTQTRPSASAVEAAITQLLNAENKAFETARSMQATANLSKIPQVPAIKQILTTNGLC